MIVESKIVQVDSIKPNLYNPNAMRDSVYQFLKKSIKKRGFLQPIIITKDGVIIDGEHRWKALKELGESEVEVKILDITEEEAKAETLNFNLTRGTFDVEKLGAILLELDQSWGKETLKDNLVMEQKQIDKTIRSFQKGQSASECLQDPTGYSTDATSTTVKPGDVYALGPHVLMCGDSTNEDDVSKLICENEIDMTLTDPPYNVNYKYNEHDDNMSDIDYEEFIKKYISISLEVSPFVAVTPGNRNEKYYYKNFDTIGTAYWYKGFALTPGTICRAMVTEPILFFGEKPKNKMLDTDHLDYRTDREAGLLEAHSCPKPVGLFKELILAFTDTGDSILDFFGGSGTTLIAADACNRIAYLMEKDPSYCQGIINRAKQIGLKVEKI